jgi:hypothetical protein
MAVPRSKALSILCDRYRELDSLPATGFENLVVRKWYESVRTAARLIFGEDSQELVDFVRVPFESDHFAPSREAMAAACARGIEEARTLLSVWIDQIKHFWPDDQAKVSPAAPPRDALATALHVCDRFPQVVLRMRKRRSGRDALMISDEYDVQYLLGALLDTHFDDVQAEDHAPTYAGGSSRIDFVLRGERVAVEAKMTRATLGAKQVGEELLVDISRYAQHGGVDALVCLVYDPDGHIVNAAGLERDLRRDAAPLVVRVLVRR